MIQRINEGWLYSKAMHNYKLHAKTPYHSPIHLYSGTSANGHSEGRTTALQWTNCLPPADNHTQYIFTSETRTKPLNNGQT